MLKKRSRRAVGFLFFILCMLPVLFGALGLATDFGRLIVAYRQVADTADTVALAGAHQIQGATINQARAQTAAAETFEQATGAGGRYPSMLPAAEGARLSNPGTLSDNNTVLTVSIEYKMTGFVIVDYLAGKRNEFTNTITRTAEICNSAQGDQCTYPNDPAVR
jgi:Flp pilus assembly protein TadG